MAQDAPFVARAASRSVEPPIAHRPAARDQGGI
jgi:hypothetical protein